MKKGPEVKVGVLYPIISQGHIGTGHLWESNPHGGDCL